MLLICGFKASDQQQKHTHTDIFRKGHAKKRGLAFTINWSVIVGGGAWNRQVANSPMVGASPLLVYVYANSTWW